MMEHIWTGQTWVSFEFSLCGCPLLPPILACSLGWCVHCLLRNGSVRIGDDALMSVRLRMGMPVLRPTTKPVMH